MRFLGGGCGVLMSGLSDRGTAREGGDEEPLPTTLKEGAAVLLYQAARQLGETLEPEKVYDRLHELLRPVIPHDGLVVSSYDAADGLIRCEYAWVGGNKLDPATLPALPLNPQGGGMQSRVIVTGESRLITNVAEQVQTQPGTYYSVDAEGQMRKLPETGPPPTKAAMMVPTKLEGQVLGVVQVMSDRVVYTAEQLALLEGIVAQLAAAVRNAKLYEELRRERGRLQALNETLEEQVRERTAQVRQLAADLTMAEQQERRQLAQNLHDSTGQLLTALQIYLKLIDAGIPEELEGLRAQMKEVRALSEQIYDEVRSVSHAMRPAALDQLGLDAALDELCREFGRRTGLVIEYEGCELPVVNEQVGITFYRFLQEALSNAAKHAMASMVQIRLAYREGDVCLAVEDNGLGFEMGRMGTAGGIGLRGLTERFQLLGGEIEIDSRVGQGTRLVGRYRIEDGGRMRDEG